MKLAVESKRAVSLLSGKGANHSWPNTVRGASNSHASKIEVW